MCELVSVWVLQGIVGNVSGLKADQSARGSIARRTLVSWNLCFSFILFKLGKVNSCLIEPNLFPVSFPGQGRWEGVQRRGDPLRRAGDPHLQEQLPPGAPGVHLGPQFVRLPPLRGGEAVHTDGASPHQLRAHAEPDPAGGGQLRGAVQTQRGRAAAAARKALREPRTQTRRTVVRMVLELQILYWGSRSFIVLLCQLTVPQRAL